MDTWTHGHIAVVVLCVFWFSAAPAARAGMAVTPFDPHEGAIPFRINSASFSQWSNAAVAISEAAQSWYHYTNADVVFDYEGMTTATASDWVDAANNGSCSVGNLVVATDMGVGSCGVAGTTQVLDPSHTCAASKAQVFLIRINTHYCPAYPTLTTDLPSTTNQKSFVSVVAHEFGHALGLKGNPHGSVPTSLLNDGGAPVDRPLFIDAEVLEAYYGARSPHTAMYAYSGNQSSWSIIPNAYIDYLSGRPGVAIGKGANNTTYAMVAYSDSRLPNFHSVSACDKYSYHCSSNREETIWHDIGTLAGPTVAYDWEGSASDRKWIIAWPSYADDYAIYLATHDDSSLPPWPNETSVDPLLLDDGAGGALWPQTLYPVGLTYDPRRNRTFIAWVHYSGRECTYAARSTSNACDIYHSNGTNHKLYNNKILIASSTNPGRYNWDNIVLVNDADLVARNGVSIACADYANPYDRSCVLAYVDTSSSRTIRLVALHFDSSGDVVWRSTTPVATPQVDSAQGPPDVEWSPSAGWVLTWRGLSYDSYNAPGYVWYYFFKLNTSGGFVWQNRGNLGTSYLSPESPTAASRKALGASTKYIYAVRY